MQLISPLRTDSLVMVILWMET